MRGLVAIESFGARLRGRFVSLSVILGTLMVISSCGTSSTGSTASNLVVKIGIATSLSAPGTYQIGLEFEKTIKAFVDWNNKQSNGVTFQIVGVEDDKGDPATGNSNVTHLIAEGAQVLIGTLGSSITQAEEPTAARHNAIMLITADQADNLTGTQYPLVFRSGAYDDSIAAGLMGYFKHLQDTSNLTSIGLLSEDSAFGLDMSTVLPAEAKKQGLSLTFNNVVFPTSANDVTGQLLALKRAAPPPQLVMIDSVFAARSIAIRQAYEVGLAPSAQLLAEWNWPEFSDFWTIVGKYGAGIQYVSLNSAANALSAAGESVKSILGATPSVYALFVWDALVALQKGVQLAKSSDTTAIAKAMEKVDFTGATGSVKFSSVQDVTYHNRLTVPTFVLQLQKQGDTAANAVQLYPQP